MNILMERLKAWWHWGNPKCHMCKRNMDFIAIGDNIAVYYCAEHKIVAVYFYKRKEDNEELRNEIKAIVLDLLESVQGV